jgi:hypothetical protein
MTIISTALLSKELPKDAVSDEEHLTTAVAQASSFVDTWTSNHYDPFDDYTTSEGTETFPAPQAIVRECLEVAKAIFWMGVGQVFRDGEEKSSWQDFLDNKETSLSKIKVNPEWKSQAISLNSSNAMVIGARSTAGFWPRIIPHTAQVVSGESNVWLKPDDWYIQQGGEHEDEYSDAWYLYAASSSVEGTLRYMRTHRNDGFDYARYGDGSA